MLADLAKKQGTSKKTSRSLSAGGKTSRSRILDRYCHEQLCPINVGINLEPPADQLHSFLHAGNADTKFEMGPGFPFLRRNHSATAVRNFQCENRVAINPYLGILTSRMAPDVSEALLHNSE